MTDKLPPRTEPRRKPGDPDQGKGTKTGKGSHAAPATTKKGTK